MSSVKCLLQENPAARERSLSLALCTQAQKENQEIIDELNNAFLGVVEQNDKVCGAPRLHLSL